MPLFPLPLPQFGEILKQYRLSRGMTVEQLAAATQLDPHAIRTFESSPNLAPSQEIIARIVAALQLNKDEAKILQHSAKLTSPFLTAIFQPEGTTPAPPPLQAAILVFMIADVRGYTRFTQANGDAAAARLTARFADITRAAIEPVDGRLIETRGDEVLVVFASARQALHAALAMQARFAAEAAADAMLPLYVGIGLDAGEAMPVDEGYRGAALNRAARLCSLATAGEILVTTGFVYLAPIVDGVVYAVRDQVQLKGFDVPVDVRAVVPAPSATP